MVHRYSALFTSSSRGCAAIALSFAAGLTSGIAKDARADAAAAGIVEARKALGDGLPQIAAVKASRLLETKSLPAETREEAASLAVEAWVRARNGARAAELIAQHPGIEHRDFWNAQAQVLNGDLAAAAESLSEWAKMGDLAERAHLSLAYVLMAQGSEGHARNELKAVRNSQDADIAKEARLLFNELELEAGRPEQVIERLSRENGGKDGAVQFLRARGLLALGEAKTSEAVVRDLLAQPNIGAHIHDGATVLGAEALLAQKKADEALRMLVQFLDRAQDSDFWREAFSLLNRCRSTLHAESQVPLAVANWIGTDGAPERRAYALLWIARWLDAAGRRSESLGMIEAFLALYPGHREESEAMRLAMKLNGELRSDARVLELARKWRSQYGGGGDSIVDFITGGIFYARGDLRQALGAFRRSAETAVALPERRRALHNAAVTAVRAGEMAVYQSLLAQIEVAGGTGEDNTKEAKAASPAVGDANAAASLDLDRALQMAAKAEPSAELEIQKFISAHPQHPRWPEAQIARAELALLDVPPRVKDAAVSLQAASQKPGLPTATLERIDYVTMWLREAEENLRGVADAGIAFVKKWPASPLSDQVRMKTAEAFYRMQDFPEARTQFELFASEHTSSPYADAALFFAGKAAMELMTPEGLEKAIEKWGELAEHGGPLAITARYQQALAKRRQGFEKEALAIIDTILADRNLDEEMKLQSQCQRIELQIVLGRTDPKQREGAVEAARKLKDQPGLSFLWKGRVGALLTQVLQDLGRDAEALEACYDIVNGGINTNTGPANPAEFFWFYWAGFRAVTILEGQKQWESAAKMAETLAQTAGDRAGEARELATRIRMQHFLWDGKKP